MYQKLVTDLLKKGYKASHIQEMETLRGIAAKWQVEYQGVVIAECYDAGDGGALKVDWHDRSHQPYLREAGLMFCRIEPVEHALSALSLYYATSA